IPGNVIGDSMVEDTNELANIILDSINLLDLSTSPLLVILSSSYFTIHTFASSDLKQISLNDTKVKSKSPFLPGNTLVDFCKVSYDKVNSDDYVRTIYANKELINSWTSTLEIIDLPIIGLVPASAHIFEEISNKVKDELIILVDIESNLTTLLIGNRSAKLTSHKLPFGSSLYISNDSKKSLKNYFERVINSINLLLAESDDSLPDNIYFMGHGVDELGVNNLLLPEKFKNISTLNLSDYNYSPDKMEIHELVSKSIESNIDSLTSVLRLCV
ncbi:pilus assembly protein PilM, partial [Prochlorococcus sp. AH-716-F10]|nr:pilus assembly protein PilM [Prochlorococcus sp. AH-716-F10]